MQNKTIKNKTGQGWGFDLVIASIIFTFSIVFFYIFSLNYSSGGQENLGELSHDGQLIADSFLSEGSPLNWNETNVVRLGVLSENRINDTKLAYFYNLTEKDYQRTKILLSIKNDYNINFSAPIYINGEQKPIIGNSSQNARNLIRISRLNIYNNKPVSININVFN